MLVGCSFGLIWVPTGKVHPSSTGKLCMAPTMSLHAKASSVPTCHPSNAAKRPELCTLSHRVCAAVQATAAPLAGACCPCWPSCCRPGGCSWPQRRWSQLPACALSCPASPSPQDGSSQWAARRAISLARPNDPAFGHRSGMGPQFRGCFANAHCMHSVAAYRGSGVM